MASNAATTPPRRPHTLGIDDGPFEKGQPHPAPIVGVMMESADLVESVAHTGFPVDGDGVTDFLADWILSLRSCDAVQAVFLGGITIAGLAVVDVSRLALRLARPVIAVNRREPANHRLLEALASAGLGERAALVEATPKATELDGVYVACGGIGPSDVAPWLKATRSKSDLPEPLRLAHLIARAWVKGESRGRP